MGEKNKPKTAYDLRRIKARVEALALPANKQRPALCHLGNKWRVLVVDKPFPDMVRTLAHHALKYSSED